MGILGVFVSAMLMGIAFGASTCKRKPLDMAILVDTSKSMSTSFTQMKNEVINFVQNFNMSSTDDVRVTVKSFDSTTQDIIGFAQGTTHTAVTNKVRSLLKLTGGMDTNTDVAINSMVHEFKSVAGTGRKSVHILIVVTDGGSSSKTLTGQAAKEARKNGVLTFVLAVGIQENVENNELRDIAGSTRHILRLGGGINVMTTKISKARLNYCLECYDVKIDLIFALDASSSLSNANYKEMKNKTTEMVKAFDIGSGVKQVQIGLIQFSDWVSYRYAFSTDRDEIIKRLQRLKRRGINTYTNLAIDDARNSFLKGRTKAKKVLVIITDGGSSKMDKTHTAAQKARNEKINIFCIGVGNDFFGNARSKREQSFNNIVGYKYNETRWFTVKDFDKLGDKKRDIVNGVCANVTSSR